MLATLELTHNGTERPKRRKRYHLWLLPATHSIRAPRRRASRTARAPYERMLLPALQSNWPFDKRRRRRRRRSRAEQSRTNERTNENELRTILIWICKKKKFVSVVRSKKLLLSFLLNLKFQINESVWLFPCFARSLASI